jgi:glucose-1-phosphate adenylyltransferase
VHDTVAVILGGGRGTRLYPLTQLRSKPAVPLAGKYRLVDIPISNCINSGLRNIFVLSQFQSASLNRHVSQTYRFDPFSRGFVEILAAEQTEQNMDWYQGTADAVRKQLHRIVSRHGKSVLILSGDQLYIMDFRRILEAHAANGADITVAATPVLERDVAGFGILQIDAKGEVADFVEKPQDPRQLKPLAADARLLAEHGVSEERRFLASMGIYVFRPEVLVRALEDPANVDFGKEVIPQAIRAQRVHSYLFNDYWEDIGTIGNFYNANLDLTSSRPPIDLFNERSPIYTRPRFLPGTRIERVELRASIVCDGGRIEDARIDRSVIGIRSVIARGSRIANTVIMGADSYKPTPLPGSPGADIPVGIGSDCSIDGAIIDKNARIGNGVVVRPRETTEPHDGSGYFARDGIVIIPKNGIIPSGTVI